MDSFRDFLEKMGSNFMVAAFIPSLGFVSLVMIAFEPILPNAVTSRLGGEFNPLGQSGLIVLIISIVLGFTLSSLSTFVYKLFEGYVFIKKFRFMYSLERRRARKLTAKKDYYRRQVKRLERVFDSLITKDTPYQEKLKYRLKEAKAQYQEAATICDSSYPPLSKYILPTRFGNILRSAEIYPRSRYGIDAVPMWPRLAYVIPPNYANKIEDSNNQCSFLLNCSLLSFVFGVFCIAASAYQYLLLGALNAKQNHLLYFIPINVPSDVYQQRIWIYIAFSILSIMIAGFFYQASLLNINRYGLMIRSAYDLFRFSLLEQFRLELPKNLNAELDRWNGLSEFMNIGDPDGTLSFSFQYQMPPVNNQAKETGHTGQ